MYTQMNILLFQVSILRSQLLMGTRVSGRHNIFCFGEFYTGHFHGPGSHTER